MAAADYQGGCLCGRVRYEISGEIKNIVYCHCSLCRKAQGSAFAANGNVDAYRFRMTAGESELTGYESSPGQTRYFCRHCGSPIFSRNTAYPERVRVRLGSIESAIRERPEAHIFVASKADWEQIGGDLPQYDTYEPGRRDDPAC